MTKALPILHGRRFGCTRCGNCCMEAGYVFFSAAELEAMAAHLGLTAAAFRRRFKVAWDEDEEAFGIDATHGRGCPLLAKEGGCTVHPVKPIQCATFPFWAELVDEAARWEETKSYCPGLDREDGRLYSFVEIRAIRNRRART